MSRRGRLRRWVQGKRPVAIRTGTHEGFDQVVFEFDERVPGYHTEYIDQPVRKCGFGRVTHLAVDGWLEVHLYPARAYTEAGQPTVADRERRPDLPVLSELELTCNFEAVVTWVFGVQSPYRYQVVELGSPPRLVVRLRHGVGHGNR
ncbi:AMIN-like domain-containing (lipo)protein [Marinobacter daqiaonensis]